MSLDNIIIIIFHVSLFYAPLVDIFIIYVVPNHIGQPGHVGNYAGLIKYFTYLKGSTQCGLQATWQALISLDTQIKFL